MAWIFLCALAGAALKNKIGKYLQSPTIILISLICVVVFSMWLFLSRERRTTVPGNYYVLGVFTFFEGILFASLTSRMEVQAVLMAIMALMIIVTALFLVVYTMKDFVGFHRAIFKAMFCAIFVQLGMVFLMISFGGFTYKDEKLKILCSVIFLILACIYLCFDLICVITPNVMDKDDYILAALMLYMDIA